MTRLRVGIVCFPTFGGSGVVATDIGLALARRGHLVHVISAGAPVRLDRFVENVFFHEVTTPEYPALEQAPYPLALASKIVDVARYQGLDLVHAHYAVPHATSAYLARQVLGGRTPKIVTTLHGTDITLVGRDPSLLPITRFSILESDAVTTPSAFLRDETRAALQIPEDRAIEVIPNFVDTDRFKPAARKPLAELRQLFGGGPGPTADARVIVHVSNFRPLKRVDHVVRVFADVQARLRGTAPVVLILVGDGPERSRVEQLVRGLGLEGAVWFLGKQASFVEVLQSSDLFLLPSEMESFGLAALEALACGVPVVASRVGGLPEVIDDGRTGHLVPPGDLDAMAAVVARILTDGAHRNALATQARATVLARWQPQALVDRMLAVYDAALS